MTTPKDTVLKCITEYQAGASFSQLAARHGVSVSAIWSHLKKAGVPRRPVSSFRRHAVNQAAFDTITEESAYWIGFLMADGCIPFQQGKSWGFIVSLSLCDRGHLEKLKSFLGSEHPISEKHIRGGGYPGSQPTCAL